MGENRSIKIILPTIGEYYKSIANNAKTTRNFALAELIDNSIESYERMHNTCDGCEIQIEFFNDKFSYNDIYDHQDIIISDNGSGFKSDIDSIENCIRLFGNHHDHSNVLNPLEKGNHNYGFKFASFYLGKGFEVNSKEINGKEFYFSIIVDKDNENIPIDKFEADPIKYDLEEKKLDKQNSGTVIKIKDIKINKIFEKDEINLLIEFLKFRYQKAILQGCKITVKSEYINTIVPKFDYEWFNIFTIPDKTKNGCFLDVSKEQKNGLLKFMKNIRTIEKHNFLNQIKNYDIFTKPITNKNEKRIFGYTENPWEKIFDKKGLYFEYNYELDTNNYIHFIWGFLSEKYSKMAREPKGVAKTSVDSAMDYAKLNGVITEIAGRAIQHPIRFINDNLTGPIRIKNYDNGSMSKLLIIANFDNAPDYVTPEHNKKALEWKNRNGEEKFKDEYMNIYKTATKYFGDSLSPITDFLQIPWEENSFSLSNGNDSENMKSFSASEDYNLNIFDENKEDTNDTSSNKTENNVFDDNCKNKTEENLCSQNSRKADNALGRVGNIIENKRWGDDSYDILMKIKKIIDDFENDK